MAQFRLSFEYQMAKRRSVKRSGFTLVEIAVALAIFVIGALAIIQIFPPALNVVRGSERRTAATQMSRARVTAYEDRAQVAPDAIYSVDATGSWEDPLSTITNAALVQTGGISRAILPSGPADATLPVNSNNPRNLAQTTLGRFKHIQGERQKVKIGHVATSDVPYVLTQFPYAGDVQIFTEETLTGVTIGANGYLDFSQAKDSKGNSVSHSASSPPPGTIVPSRPRNDLRDATLGQNCVFYVTYRWLPAGGRMQGVVDEPLVIPLDADAGWTAAPITNNRVLQTTNVVPGSVSVRVRKRVGTRTPGTAMPASPSPINEAALGLVRLDSLNTFDPSAPLANGDIVSLDYNVADWRNIVLDEIPNRPTDGTTANLWNVLMPMQNLNPEGPILAFFARPNPSAPTITAPVLGGATWPEATPSPPGTLRIMDANPSAGRISYEIPPVDATDPTPATPTRTVLSSLGATLTTNATVVGTLDEWGQQLIVAAASYHPFNGSGSLQHPREAWRQYAWTSGNSIMYFQAAEAGKLVMVDYEYPDTSAPGGYRQVQGAIFPISLDIDAPFPAPAGFAPTSNQAAAIKLTTLNGTVLAPASAITAVRGVSIAARTAWLENGRYQQVVTKGYRPLVSAL